MDMSFSELWELVIYTEAWHAAVHGVTKSQTRLSNWNELRELLSKIPRLGLHHSPSTKLPGNFDTFMVKVHHQCFFKWTPINPTVVKTENQGFFFLIGGQYECENVYNTCTHNENNVFFPTILLSCKAQILAASFKEKKASLDLLEDIYSLGQKKSFLKAMESIDYGSCMWSKSSVRLSADTMTSQMTAFSPCHIIILPEIPSSMDSILLTIIILQKCQ